MFWLSLYDSDYVNGCNLYLLDTRNDKRDLCDFIYESICESVSIYDH